MGREIKNGKVVCTKGSKRTKVGRKIVCKGGRK